MSKIWLSINSTYILCKLALEDARLLSINLYLNNTNIKYATLRQTIEAF